MLYELIELAIMLAFFVVLLLVIAILVSILRQLNCGNSQKTENIPRIFSKKHKKAPKNAELERYNTVLRNIDTYDGTDLGQEEVNG